MHYSAYVFFCCKFKKSKKYFIEVIASWNGVAKKAILIK